MFNNTIYVLNGPSASGKDTVLEELLKIDLNLEKLITVTTRVPRITPHKEVDGIDYYFISKEEFLKRKEEGSQDKIVEETEYPKNSGVFYGIFDSEIERIRGLGKDAVAILDIHGVSEMKRFYGDENVVSIFIHRSLDEIEKGLRDRKLPEDEIQKRLNYAKKEYMNQDKADYLVFNDSSKEHLVNKVINIIDLERKKTSA